MDDVQALLNKKGCEVWTIQPDETVLDGIRQMAGKNVGSLVVVEDGKPVGIFTERHYAREILLKGRNSPTTPIREIMNARFVFAEPEQTIEECMVVMTNEAVRHLPVLDRGELVGIISIGDLVKSKIADQENIIEKLTQYIHG